MYIQPLPDDIEAVITVKPKSIDYSSNNIFSIDNQKLNSEIKDIDNNKGYISEHDFKLVSTGTKNDIRYEMFNNVKPTYDYEGDIGKIVEKKITDEDNPIINNKKSSPMFGLVIFVIIIIIGLFLFFKVIKKKQHK